jgi:hypothetical protein
MSFGLTNAPAHFMYPMNSVFTNAKDIRVDPSKVQEVLDWKSSRSVTKICSFLRLVASKIGSTLKKLLTTAPVLAQPDIEKLFDVYCDASGTGIGGVLMQNV